MTARTIDRRLMFDRRNWRTFLSILFAPVMFSRRRSERRTGWDRRARAERTLKAYNAPT